MSITKSAVDTLLDIMARLRDPVAGCPWDVKQTFASIAPYTIEEAYEVADAIDRGDYDDLRSELGDLLLQVVFHARMAEEQGHFDFVAVCEALTEKLIRRHPHVFADSDARSEAELHAAWEAQKSHERQAKKNRGDDALLADIALPLPALKRAEKIQKRVARVGFDWPELASVYAKIEEEIAEVKAAVDHREQQEEIGDLLFAVVNLARHLGVDAEEALRQSNNKFQQRFAAVEAHAKQAGRELKAHTLAELEAYWQAAKAQIKP